MAPKHTISIDDPMFDPVEVLPSEPYTRCVPLLINAPDAVRSAVQMHIDHGMVVPPNARIGRVKNAIAIARGILIDHEHRIIAESLINLHDQSRFELEVAPAYDIACTSAELPKLPDGEGPFVMLKQTWDGNYGHWLIESLPRVGIVARQFEMPGLGFFVSVNTHTAL